MTPSQPTIWYLPDGEGLQPTGWYWTWERELGPTGAGPFENAYEAWVDAVPEAETEGTAAAFAAGFAAASSLAAALEAREPDDTGCDHLETYVEDVRRRIKAQYGVDTTKAPTGHNRPR